MTSSCNCPIVKLRLMHNVFFIYPFGIAEFVLNWLVGRSERKGPQNEAGPNQLANTTWGETRVLNNRCSNRNLFQNDVFFLRAWPLTLLSSSSSAWRSETEKCLSRSTSISLNNLKKENNKPLMRNLSDLNMFNFHRVQTSNASRSWSCFIFCDFYSASDV